MKQLLLVFSFLLIITDCFCQQPVQIHLKKNGRVKKRIAIGDELIVFTNKNEIISGNIYKLTTDSIYFRNATIAINTISHIKFQRGKKRMHIDLKEFGFVSLGVVLTTAGLVAAEWNEFPEALGIAAAIGYTPYIFGLLKSISLRKYKFKIGNRYTLRVWDIRLKAF